ncbi:MAG: TetR/AcrR family transcriptional regulator [Polyangia bacterium]
MTRHRTPEQRREEILEAAAAELIDSGSSRLTMEAVAARTALSKGGVYRFFANRGELSLALFARCYERALDFDMREVLDWGLPLRETVFRLLFSRFDESHSLDESVWVRLIPETLRDPRFRRERMRLTARIRERFAELVRCVVERDGLRVRPGFDERLDTSLMLGQAMLEGLTLQGPAGEPRGERAELLLRFIDLLLHDALEVGDG